MLKRWDSCLNMKHFRSAQLGSDQQTLSAGRMPRTRSLSKGWRLNQPKRIRNHRWMQRRRFSPLPSADSRPSRLLMCSSWQVSVERCALCFAPCPSSIQHVLFVQSHMLHILRLCWAWTATFSLCHIHFHHRGCLNLSTQLSQVLKLE